ncbi:ArsR family transcriptional regulator [Paraburkholderia phytofirmans]|uniref:ArsR family transcriptional regulator n=1 Tax=Paraburkholderia phytofirmans TaxID=261302 RepID=UPI0038BA824F
MLQWSGSVEMTVVRCVILVNREFRTMNISTSKSAPAVRNDGYASGEDGKQTQEASEGAHIEEGGSSAASQTDKAAKALDAPIHPNQRNAAVTSGGRSDGTIQARAAASRRSGAIVPTAVALSGGATADAASTKPSAGGSNITPSSTLPGATVAEFTELNKEFDTAEGLTHANSDRNIAIAKRMEKLLEVEMTGYPPDVVRFEKSQLDVRARLVDLPLSQREFYGSALAMLSAAYRLETDPARRLAINEQALELDGVIRNAYARAVNDPVDRALAVFNPPLGEANLNKYFRERVDRLERLREDFLDAKDAVERKAIFREAARLKEQTQSGADFATAITRLSQRDLWQEANAAVDRILKQAEAQTDPAKRYELIGRQLFQINPGQDRLKDKVVLAFTQRMYNSLDLRNKLHAWHIDVTGPLNKHSVGGPKRYTDILNNLPPVSADYIRDLNDKYTDVLQDASFRNYSITPKARAEKLVGQILEVVMRILLEVTPLGILGDIIPSKLPDNVRMGIEFGGMILDVLTGVGVGKQVGRGAKAIAAAARKIELDDLAGKGVRAAGKGLVDDAGERIIKETLADQALSPEAKLAAQALEKKSLAEAGPPVDPVSELAHEAVGISSYGSLANYADPHVVPDNLRRGAQPGILEDSKGDRYIELGGKAYRVRFDRDNDTWRVFDKTASWRPQYPVRLNEKTNTWEVHGNVGLMGGGSKKIGDALRQEITVLLNDGVMSHRAIAARVGVSPAAVDKIAKELSIGLSAPDSLRNLRISPETQQEAIRLLKEGELSRSDIAETLHISRAAVSKIAKDNKIVPLGNAATRQTITPEIRLQVEKLLEQQTLSDGEIARRTKISRPSVSKIRREMRLSPAASLRGLRISPADRADIVKRLRGGATQSEVVRSTGLASTTVWRIARQEQIPAGGMRPPATPGQIDLVFALRDQGNSVREVARRAGLSERRVRDIYANVNTVTDKRLWWETTPEKRTAALRQLDQGKASKDVATELDLPVDTVRGIANQHRMARDSLARELSIQGQSPEEVAGKLGISPEYVKRLRQGVPEGTHEIHDIHLNSEDGAVAEDVFQKGYTREDVAGKLGISLWQAHKLANEYRTKTMDSVMPKQLADLVSALNDQDHTFTTGELARACGLPETTVMVVEQEYEMGSIISHARSPQPGPSHGPADTGVTYEWVRPLTVEQETQAIRGIDDGKRLRQVADELHVDVAAVERLYEEDISLVAPADDPIAPPPDAAPAPATPSATMPLPAAVVLSEADKLEIRKLARNDQLSPDFIANLFEIPVEEVNKVLH